MLAVGCGGWGTGSSPQPYVATRELPEIVIDDPGTPCPELPPLPADASEVRKALYPRAVAVRRLACEPALYDQPTAAMMTELALPPEANLEGERFSMGGTSPDMLIAVKRTMIPAAELASALGLSDPKAHLDNAEHGLWGMQAGGTGRISWKTLELHVHIFPPASGGHSQPLDAFGVATITVRTRGS